MKKLQEELHKMLSQYEVINKISKFDVLFMAILPIYKILARCGLSFVWKFNGFYNVFLVLFVIGVVLAFANNRLKGAALAFLVLVIASIIDVVKGNYDEIITAVILAVLGYVCLAYSNGEDILKKLTAKVETKETPTENKPAASSAEAGKVCPKCGAAVAESSSFCTSCGEKLS